jgi:ATP-dependent RNA helicase RhlE
MNAFTQFDLTKPLFNAVEELGFTKPTPMQEKAFSAVRSGRDIVGIAQTGTGNTGIFASNFTRFKICKD